MDFSQILYEKVERVARVTLNRPEYRNPIGRICIEELDEAFADAAQDEDVRAIVLRANGPHFSAGHDLGTPAKMADDEARPYPPGARGRFQRSWELYIEPGLRWRNLPKPTIAAVHGHCIWGGWMVATTMDIIFAAENTQFLGSDFQYFSVPWDVGIRKAKEILFEPRFISAQEAMALGFVNRILPRDQLDDEVMEYASRVAQHNSFSLRMTKLHINQAQDLQGYTNHIISAHTKPGEGSSQGAQLPSGQRRIAPIDEALRNMERARGVIRAGKLEY